MHEKKITTIRVSTVTLIINLKQFIKLNQITKNSIKSQKIISLIIDMFKR